MKRDMGNNSLTFKQTTTTKDCIMQRLLSVIFAPSGFYGSEKTPRLYPKVCNFCAYADIDMASKHNN